MFCLSDLLSELHGKRGKQLTAKQKCIISSAPLVPELIDGCLDNHLKVLNACQDALFELQPPEKCVAMHVFAPAIRGNLCALSFEFTFDTDKDCSTINQQLAEAQYQCDLLGAQLTLSDTQTKQKRLQLEMNVKARTPTSIMSLPSWLYGKPTLLIDPQDSSEPSHTNTVLKEMGAKLVHKVWDARATIDMLIKCYREGMFGMTCIIDFDQPDLPPPEVLSAIIRLCDSGLLSSHVELLLLVPHHVHKLIPSKYLNIAGYKIVKAPLTMHRLINPKSTLMQSSILRMENYLSKSPDTVEVLLVDNCDLTRRLMKNYFEDKGFGIIESANAKQAIEIAQSRNFDAVLMELHLPDMSGFELTKLFKSEKRCSLAPIIGITDSKNLSDYQRCFDVGMNDCVGKPLYFTDLMSRIRGWLAEDKEMFNAI